MFRRIRKLLCAMALVLLVLALIPALASGTKATFTTSTKVYQKMSTSSNSVKVSKGTEVKVVSVEGKWAKVSRNGKTAYVPVKYLQAADRKAVYVSKDCYVYKSASSSSSKKSVSVNTKVYIVGRDGDYYRVENAKGTRVGYIKTSCVSSSKVKVTSAKVDADDKSDTSWKSKVVKLDWFSEGCKVLRKGNYGYIYDIDTGITIKIKRMGGHYHMDVEPATAADTRKLLRASHGKWSWDSRAVILMAGDQYVASAINTMPHGDQTITNNNYDGQFCLHTSGSLTHCSSKENSSHQRAINKAYDWAMSD